MATHFALPEKDIIPDSYFSAINGGTLPDLAAIPLGKNAAI